MCTPYSAEREVKLMAKPVRSCFGGTLSSLWADICSSTFSGRYHAVELVLSITVGQPTHYTVAPQDLGGLMLRGCSTN
jgi:hypothetical protein